MTTAWHFREKKLPCAYELFSLSDSFLWREEPAKDRSRPALHGRYADALVASA